MLYRKTTKKEQEYIKKNHPGHMYKYVQKQEDEMTKGEKILDAVTDLAYIGMQALEKSATGENGIFEPMDVVVLPKEIRNK